MPISLHILWLSFDILVSAKQCNLCMITDNTFSSKFYMTLHTIATQICYLFIINALF